MLTKLGISTAPGAMIGAAADDRAGHRAEARRGESLVAPAGEFDGTLSHQWRAAGAARDRVHRVEPERQQHGFLEPLVDRSSRRRPSRRRAPRRDRARRSPPRPPRDTSPARRGRTTSRSSQAASMIAGSWSRHWSVPKIISSQSPTSVMRWSMTASSMVVVAALGAIVDPDRGHAERFRRRQILRHVLDQQRARRVDRRSARTAGHSRAGRAWADSRWRGCRAARRNGRRRRSPSSTRRA